MTKRSPIDQGTVLITGASAGIGLALAHALAPRARRLLLVARRRERLEALAAELRAAHAQLEVRAIACDLADLEACERLVAEVGEVDVLVNNAGIGHHTLFETSRPAASDAVLRINVLAPLALTRALLPGMLERGRGAILNIGSGAGVSPMPGEAVYAGSKHFIHGLSTTLALELEGTGVRITEVMPGPVSTEWDVVAGVGAGGGGLPKFFEISAEQCARESIRALDRGTLICYPGWRYRMLMRLRDLLPSSMQRAMMRKSARQLRAAAQSAE